MEEKINMKESKVLIPISDEAYSDVEEPMCRIWQSERNLIISFNVLNQPVSISTEIYQGKNGPYLEITAKY